MPGVWIWVVVAAVVIVALFFVAGGYNRLVTLRNRHLNAWSQIDVQLKRRHDLIPNLVNTVKGYMAHERETLEAVIAARNAATSAVADASARPADTAAILAAGMAESRLMGVLGRFRMLAENYPDLKADASARSLMEELTSTENRVAFARQAYNDAVTLYNTARMTFPTVLIAGLFGFGPAALFEIQDASEREVVKVDLG